MKEVHVIFCYWEDTGKNQVCHTAKNFGDRHPCSILEPWYQEKTNDSDFIYWRYKTSQCTRKYLYGPAGHLSTKSIVYTCYRSHCWIFCPCFQCRGYLCDRFSTETLFKNHKCYHLATHANCKFCCQMLDIFPFYSFRKTIGKSVGMFGDGTYYVQAKGYEFKHTFSLMDSKRNPKSHSFKCDVCGKRFKKSSNRDRHYETVHYKQKNYKCHICAKVFGRADNLERHKQVHKDSHYLSPKNEFEESNTDETSSNDDDSSVEESSSDLTSNEDISDNDDYRTYIMDELIKKLQVLILLTLFVKSYFCIYWG